MDVKIDLTDKDLEKILREEISKKVVEFVTTDKLTTLVERRIENFIALNVDWNKAVRGSMKSILREECETQYKRNITNMVNEFFKENKKDIINRISNNITDMMYDAFREQVDDDD